MILGPLAIFATCQPWPHQASFTQLDRQGGSLTRPANLKWYQIPEMELLVQRLLAFSSSKAATWSKPSADLAALLTQSPANYHNELDNRGVPVLPVTSSFGMNFNLLA